MTTMIVDPPSKTSMGVGFDSNRGRMGDAQAWRKTIGTRPVSARLALFRWFLDRKSTRLNSSHSQISYAVFCLKKKKIDNRHDRYGSPVRPPVPSALPESL